MLDQPTGDSDEYLLALALVAALGVSFTACGDEAKKVEAEAKADTPAQTETESGEMEDTDADGILDSVDPDPYSPSEPESSEPEETWEEEPAEPVQKMLSVGQGGRDDGLGFKALLLGQVESIPAADEFSDPSTHRPAAS